MPDVASKLLGRMRWEGGFDNDLHRTYEIDWLVEVADAWNDGPVKALLCPDLPTMADWWQFGYDVDQYAFCQPEMTCKQVLTGEANELYLIGQKFSTKPLKKPDDNAENPLLKAPEISGSFVKYTRETAADKDGKAIRSSSWERYKGSVVERDYSRHTINIKMVSATLPLTTYMDMVDSVNSVAMWGLPVRTVKLSNVSWTKHFYGTNWSLAYYDIGYDFDIDFDTWDRVIQDEGTKVLKSGGSAANPKDFEPYLVKGQPSPVVLNGSGQAATSEGTIGYLNFKLYKERNLLLLGVPTTL